MSIMQKIVAYLGILVLGVGIGWVGSHYTQVLPLREEVMGVQASLNYEIKKTEFLTLALQDSKESRKVKDNQIQGFIGQNTQTSISYTERPKDPVTLEPTGPVVDVQTRPAEFTVGVNGKEVPVKLITGESYAFEKGKLNISQSSTAFLDLKIPEPKPVEVQAGVWVMNKGIGGKVQIKSLDLMAGVEYKTGKPMYGVTWILYRK